MFCAQLKHCMRTAVSYQWDILFSSFLAKQGPSECHLGRIMTGFSSRVSSGGTLVSSGFPQSCVIQQYSYLQNTIPSPFWTSIKKWDPGSRRRRTLAPPCGRRVGFILGYSGTSFKSMALFWGPPLAMYTLPMMGL